MFQRLRHFPWLTAMVARRVRQGEDMSPIIAGRFALERDAQRALEGLRHQGFGPDDVTAFSVEPLVPRAKMVTRRPPLVADSEYAL